MTITITLTGGLNPVASALMFGPVPSTKPTASASFVAVDATTQGNWSGVYGYDGYSVVGGTTSLPGYATLAVNGASQYVWANPTSDIRAPQASAGSATRVAACDYSNSTSFSIDLNLTDGQTHEVAIYVLDWDQRGRAETLQITDAGTETVPGLTHDSRTSRGPMDRVEFVGPCSHQCDQCWIAQLGVERSLFRPDSSDDCPSDGSVVCSKRFLNRRNLDRGSTAPTGLMISTEPSLFPPMRK